MRHFTCVFIVLFWIQWSIYTEKRFVVGHVHFCLFSFLYLCTCLWFVYFQFIYVYVCGLFIFNLFMYIFMVCSFSIHLCTSLWFVYFQLIYVYVCGFVCTQMRSCLFVYNLLYYIECVPSVYKYCDFGLPTVLSFPRCISFTIQRGIIKC